MIKQFTLPVCCLAFTLLMACSNDPKSTKKPGLADSVNIKDSVATAVFSEADENKVIGNINFGIDKKQFDKEQEAFIASLDHNEFQTIHAIGGYLFSDLTGKFDLHKLNEVTTTGDFIHQERYEAELIPQVEILKNLIAKKYGKPNEGRGAPDYHVIKKDQAYTAYSWLVGTKVIQIKVVNRGVYSSCDLKIFKK